MNDTIETINVLRELAKINKERKMMLPTEMVDIIEGKITETSWKEIDISNVMNYIASMMES